MDTWFSSCLAPLSVSKFFNSANDRRQYPHDLLETGADILNIWVSRMIMLCTYFTGQVPFRRIFLHPMVRDSEGKKMSKTLGNVIDPLSIIQGRTLPQLIDDIQSGNSKIEDIARRIEKTKKEFPEGIPAFGVDSLRLCLLSYSLNTKFLLFDLANCRIASQFLNKIFQATKFVLQYSQITDPLKFNPQEAQLIYNRAIISQISRLSHEVLNDLQNMNISCAIQSLKQFSLV